MEINSDGIIRADIMTARIEDKNLLTKKGDIYVGTGVTTSYDGTDVYQTKAMNIQAAITEDVKNNTSHILNLGAETCKGANAISLGYNANVNADNAVQIGGGTNAVANSLKFGNRTVVNGSGEIVGDYPLGFTKRVMGSTWPKSHVDLTNGTIVTDWAFIGDNGSTSEIVFLSTFNQENNKADLNLVIDGNVYVDDGKRKVYAEGDIVDRAKQADYPTGFTKRQTSGWDDGWPKNHSDLAGGTVVTDWCYDVDGGRADIAFVKTYDSGNQTSNLNLVIDGNVYVDDGKRKVYAEGDIVDRAKQAEVADTAINAHTATKATVAEKTAFSNEAFTGASPMSLKLERSGTYQFYYAPLGFSCLLYCQLFIADHYSPIFVAPKTIGGILPSSIAKDQKFIMKIKSSGEVVWLKESTSLTDDWIEFDPSDEHALVYYRIIR